MLQPTVGEYLNFIRNLEENDFQNFNTLIGLPNARQILANMNTPETQEVKRMATYALDIREENVIK